MECKVIVPEWKKVYEIGIPEIDYQHQYFLMLIERLASLVRNGLDDKLVCRYLNEIILYANFHFCSEEKIMLMNEYPDYINHRQLHLEIIQELSNRISQFEVFQADFDEIISYMVTWFLDHTVEVDRELGVYVQKG